MRVLFLAAALLAGCSSNTAWQVSAGVPPPAAPAHAHVHGGYGFATAVGVAILAAGAYQLTRDGVEYGSRIDRVAPGMAPDRKVAEQDCTKPLDFTLGNIRCK